VIRFALVCDRGHGFDAWFRAGADYERAVAAGDATCPLCGSAKVEKAIMAPAVAGGRDGGETVRLAAVDPRRKALQALAREYRRQVAENADYVGDRFAEEARKIHFDEVEPRGIWGEATREEAVALAEEGVSFQPLPPLPDEAN
jgi:hypothetical protein